MLIRSFRDADAAGCAAIVRACIESDPSLTDTLRGRFLRSLTEASIIERSRLHYLAVCELSDSLAGLAGLDMNEIRLLCVSPERQGRGIGAALLGHLESMVPAPLFADVFVYATLSAVGFYLKHGYRAEGEWQVEIAGETLTTMFLRKPLSQRTGDHRRPWEA